MVLLLQDLYFPFNVLQEHSRRSISVKTDWLTGEHIYRGDISVEKLTTMMRVLNMSATVSALLNRQMST